MGTAIERLNFLDQRSDDGHGVVGVAKLQVHTAPDIPRLEHGSAPSAAFERDQDRFGAILRVAGDQGLAFSLRDDGIATVLGEDKERGFRRKIFEGHTAFDLRLNDMAIDRIAQIRVRPEI